MNTYEHARFQALHQRYLTELTLRGKSPKTIDLYMRCLRQVSDHFDTYSIWTSSRAADQPHRVPASSHILAHSDH